MSIAANAQETVRRTGQALLDAWDDPRRGSRNITLDGLMDALRAALAACAQATSDTSRHPKDTKQGQVLAMLRRQEGASGPAIAEATGWAPHTVREFLTALVKKGVKVGVLERVRQVSPNKQGAKGSYTVYQLVREAQP